MTGSYYVCLCILVTKSCLTVLPPHGLCSPLGSSVHEFPRQECWNGLPFPSPGNGPDPGIEPASLALGDEFFITEPPG